MGASVYQPIKKTTPKGGLKSLRLETLHRTRSCLTCFEHDQTNLLFREIELFIRPAFLAAYCFNGIRQLGVASIVFLLFCDLLGIQGKAAAFHRCQHFGVHEWNNETLLVFLRI